MSSDDESGTHEAGKPKLVDMLLALANIPELMDAIAEGPPKWTVDLSWLRDLTDDE